MRTLQIHLQDDASLEEGLRVSEIQLREALAAAGVADAAGWRISVAEGAGPLPGNMGEAEILFTTTKLDFSDLATRAPKLKLVQTISAGVEAFLKTLPASVTLCNASGVHGTKGAEFVLAALLMLNFDIPRFADDKVARVWRPAFGPPIAGKRATLLGVGAIGAAVARRLQGFGLSVTGVTRAGTSDAPLDRCVAVAKLDAILPETDYLVSSLPLTPLTAGLVSRARLAMLPAGAGIVSVGRANVFDCDALLEALHSGHLGGAVLDVFPVEPLPADSPFWTAPRVIITPHCSLDDHRTYREACLAIFADNVLRYVEGRPARNVVDPTLGY